MRLVERDYKIMYEIGRWGFMLGRHIKDMCGFSSVSACDKRLKLLIEAGFLSRKKYIYGIPSLYTLSHRGRILSGYNKRAVNIRIERINHDIYVLDTALWLMRKINITAKSIVTEHQLHAKDGFGVSKHYPDFVVVHNKMTYAVEIELSLKEKKRFEGIIRDNYKNYDRQVWVVPENQKKIINILNDNTKLYKNLRIYYLEEIKK